MKRLIVFCALTASAAMAQSTVTGSKTMQGTWDASGASATKPARSGAALPGTCGTGEFFFNTSATPGQNLYLCDPDNSWTQVTAGVTKVFGRTGNVSAQTGDYTFAQIGGSVSSTQLPAAGGDITGSLTAASVGAIQGKAVSSASPSSGQILTWNGSQWAPQTPAGSLSGDVSGSLSATTVQAIQGKSIAATAPSSGQVLTFNGSAWAPQDATGGSGGGANSQLAIFDGSTTSLADGSSVSWAACGTNAKCATWTVPSGVYWVQVDLWGGGGPGLGAGGNSGGAGGAGGGYGHRVCAVNAGGTVTVQVGMGGAGGSGYGSSGATAGGDSSFGTCIGASGGTLTNTYYAGNTPGVMKAGTEAAPPGPFLSNNGYYTALVSGLVGAQTAGFVSVREDQGGYPGGGWLGATGAGAAGGMAIGGGAGGGAGASQNATGGAAGTTVLGGPGGIGGSSSAACTQGGIPGGGGGGAYVPASGNSAGCSGGRGEVRIYYAH